MNDLNRVVRREEFSQTSCIKGRVKGIGVTLVSMLLLSCGGDHAAPKPQQISGPASSMRASIAIDYPDTEAEAARFLMRASFGPTEAEIEEVMTRGYSAWILTQLSLPVVPYLPRISSGHGTTSDSIDATRSASLFWSNAVGGQDQLRQRAAFAMSEIMVVSAFSGSIRGRGRMIASYMDVMQDAAFGNFRDTMEAVTYNPTMGIYLTYLGNEALNTFTGAVPDENYARELMQLFTIGLVELNQDGTLQLDGTGNIVETYDNDDITELAKVFTGLWWAGEEFRRGSSEDSTEALPMVMTNEYHSKEAKSFLGLTIPQNTPGEETIDMALDHLFMHQNTAPFISKQLIQRFVTSNPSPAYVQRVSAVFSSGSFQVPSGEFVGEGQRGDMGAVIAAILLDPEVLSESNINDPTFGKVREPVIRFAHWARTFKIGNPDPDRHYSLTNTSSSTSLGQQAYRSPSVFNFFRPGHVAAGSLTAQAGLVAPELQTTDASTVIGYINFMDRFVRQNQSVYEANYDVELSVVETPDILADRLSLLLMGGRMSPETRARMIDAVNSVTGGSEDLRPIRRVHAAITIAVNSPEFLVQL